jgi:hypothetical protein
MHADSMVQYMISFGASLNAIPWLYSTEILPIRVRAQGTALAVFNNWIWVKSQSNENICFALTSLIGILDCHGHANLGAKSPVEDLSHLHVIRKSHARDRHQYRVTDCAC